MANQKPRPQNFSRAKAKAVTEQAARLPMTLRIEMVNELAKNRAKLTCKLPQPRT